MQLFIPFVTFPVLCVFSFLAHAEGCGSFSTRSFQNQACMHTSLRADDDDFQATISCVGLP